MSKPAVAPTKPKPKPKPTGEPTVSVTTGNSQTGQYTTKTTIPGAPIKPKDPESERARLAAKFGLYEAVLDAYPEFRDLIRRAVKDYQNDGEWSDERFWAEFNNTQFAKDRQKAEELFDINIIGPNADTYQKKVDDTYQLLVQNSQRLGIPLSEEQLRTQARNIVRSDLSQGVVDKFWSAQYESMTTPGEADQIAGKPLTGAAAQIQKSLSDTARSYGIKISEETLRAKTGEALSQGDRWQEYLQGQEEVFRQQAKMLFPKASTWLDSQNLTQIAEPYFQEAANVLGTVPSEMDITDPKWTAFLNGENGPLSKDEWTRVLRTDSKYGYDHSLNARKEYSGLTDALFAAFDMA